MNSLVWLVSYPRSGNTWFRAFLANLTMSGEGPADINRLHVSVHAASREMFDVALGVESSDLLDTEILSLRRRMYLWFGQTARREMRFKVHEGYRRCPDGAPMFPPEVTRATLYLIRNPLDVAVSYADHRAVAVGEAIALMDDEGHTLAGHSTKLVDQLPQWLGSWTSHASSWIESAGMNVLVIRYEDMQNQPLETFRRAAEHVGCTGFSDAEILRAVELSSFRRLQQQEQEAGFVEASPLSPRFFREGKIGSWRRQMTAEEFRRVIRSHRAMMRQFGYDEASD